MYSGRHCLAPGLSDLEAPGQRLASVPVEQSILYDLLRHGVVDPRLRDRAFDVSTRAMRYSAAITDWVWALLDKETTRVSFCDLL